MRFRDKAIVTWYDHDNFSFVNGNQGFRKENFTQNLTVSSPTFFHERTQIFSMPWRDCYNVVPSWFVVGIFWWNILFWSQPSDTRESSEKRYHVRTKARIAPERLYHWGQVAFSFSNLKPQGGVSKQARFYISREQSAGCWGQWPIVSAVSLSHSVPGSERNHAWQMGSTNNALSQSGNKSVSNNCPFLPYSASASESRTCQMQKL